MKQYETIIIGAGISGLGAAQQLKKEGKEFLILTENIGGRIQNSKNKKTEYGAYFFTKDQRELKPFLAIKKRFKPKEIIAVDKKKYRPAHQFIKYPIESIRFLRLNHKFKNNLKKLEKSNSTQEQYLKSNPFLLKFYKTTMDKISKQYKIPNITEKILRYPIGLCTFTDINKINAFDVFHLSMNLNHRIYEFTFKEKEIRNKFKKQLKKEKVISIKNKIITTNKNKYNAKNIILATPPHITQKLLKIKKIKKPIKTEMIHLKGNSKHPIKKGEIVVMKNKGWFAKQIDNTYLFYKTNPKTDIKNYFKNIKIIHKQKWDPAFNMIGHEIWPSKIKGIHIAGDHNICGMKSSYLTGVHAAKQILKKL